MRALRIRADLVRGYAAKDPWSPTIDGILAAIVMRARLGGERYVSDSAMTSTLAPVDGLPLAVERHGLLWWYAASSPIPVDVAGRERRYFHRRFDDQYERHLAGGVRKVMTSAGPYKATRLFDTRIMAAAVEWHVIGEQGEIEPLVRQVWQIGGRRAVGYGEVSGWTITDDGDADLARWHRPLPAAYAEVIGRQGPRVPWGLTPPGRLNLVDCIMPEDPHA